MSVVEQLQALIRRKFGCEAVRVESVRVREVEGGRIVWDGQVQVFRLEGHQRARRCFGWHHVGPDGRERFSAMLEEGHVDSPRAAVRAAMVDESRRQGQ